MLPVDADTFLVGVDHAAFSATYDTYIADMIIQLEAQTAESYNPSMTALDSLVNSIQVTP